MNDETTRAMDVPLSCEVVVARTLAERYLTGELTEAEQVAYEAHYFGCPRCLDELRTLEAAREALVSAPVSPEIETRPTVTSWRPWLALAAGLVVAVSASLWLIRPVPEATLGNQGVVKAPSPEASAPSLQAPESAAPASDPVAKLAMVKPPPYLPSRLRGVPNEAAESFARAMRLYAEGRYREAIPGLEQASRIDSAPASASFYLGTCYLLTGQPDRALGPLDRVIALGETPYLEEAWFLKAKALIAQRDFEGARAALVTVTRLQGDREQDARALLGELRAATKEER